MEESKLIVDDNNIPSLKIIFNGREYEAKLSEISTDNWNGQYANFIYTTFKFIAIHEEPLLGEEKFTPELSQILKGLGINDTPEAREQIGKCICSMDEIMKQGCTCKGI